MRVYLAAKVLSNTMLDTLKAEVDEGVLRDSRHLPGGDSYTSLLGLIEKMDVLTDICNTNKTTQHPKKSGRHPFQPVRSFKDVQITHLLETLEYFCEWKHSLDADPNLSFTDATSSFFSPETSREIIDICLGLPCMARFYLKGGKGNREITFRRIQSDVCEHHFGNIRYFSHSGTAGATIDDCMTGSGDSCAVRANNPKNSNFSQAPTSGDGEEMLDQSKLWSKEELSDRRSKSEVEQGQRKKRRVEHTL